jgi:hypothetical protein
MTLKITYLPLVINFWSSKHSVLVFTKKRERLQRHVSSQVRKVCITAEAFSETLENNDLLWSYPFPLS